jgi:integrase
MVRHGFSIGKIETPKNGKSRHVDMSQQLTDTLRELQLQRKAETLRKGWGTVPEWVFISESGKPLILNHWRKGVFDRALGKAKLRKIRILDLRHSYASMLIHAGESLAISEIS